MTIDNTDFQAELEADIAAAARAQLRAELERLAPRGTIQPPQPVAAVTSGGGRPSTYKTQDGKRVPGVTTILGKFKDAGGLIHWAWECGRDGKDYRDVRDQAASVGHVAHQWIDDSIHSRELASFPELTVSDRDKAKAGYYAFLDWRAAVHLEIVDTERPLVSETLRFGGTYDALGYVHGELTLIDWKTSNRVYTEYVAQLAAYRHLINEWSPPHPAVREGEKVKGARLLRVGKELGDFTDHSFPSAALDLGWERFQASLALYLTDAALKKGLGL